MGRQKRKRKIPKDTKKTKYLYFIVVKFQGQNLLKFGISNNFIRRFTEYNNSETVGYIIDILDVYKCDFPQRLEHIMKWKMMTIAKPIFKQEYFEMKYYGLLLSKAQEYANELEMSFCKII